MQPGFAIVTPVRDRLEHLRATLPSWCALPGVAEIVICDFGSEPGIPLDITAGSPKIKLVRAGKGEPWNPGLAQNIGILAAEHDLILKADCDVYLQHIERYREMVVRGAFVSGYIPIIDQKADLSKRGCCGQILFDKKHWRMIGGYHEFLNGWGFDDQDFYNRLEDAGIAHAFFDLDDLRDIPHDDSLRGKGRIIDDFPLSVPPEVRSAKHFQNMRNKLIAGLVPWTASFARQRVLRRLGDGVFECVLEPKSKFEQRVQLTTAFITSRFWNPSEVVEREFLAAIVDERIGQYTAQAMAQKARGGVV